MIVETKKETTSYQTNWAELGQPNLKLLGKKKQAKLLQNHGLSVGKTICVTLHSISTRNGETMATYNICEQGLSKFKGAMQIGRPLDELRKQMEYKLEDRLEIAYITGVSGDAGKLWLVIDRIMDDSWRDLPTEDVPEDDDDTDGPHYDILNGYDHAPGPLGRAIPIQRWMELTAEGCAKCGKVFKPTDDIVWDEVVTGQYIVFCKGCASQARVREG